MLEKLTPTGFLFYLFPGSFFLMNVAYLFMDILMSFVSITLSMFVLLLYDIIKVCQKINSKKLTVEFI